MFKKIKNFFVVLVLSSITTQFALAESLNKDDMAFAFNSPAVVNSDVALLSNQEMAETEGNVFPLYAIGVFVIPPFFIVFKSRRLSHIQ